MADIYKITAHYTSQGREDNLMIHGAKQGHYVECNADNGYVVSYTGLDYENRQPPQSSVDDGGDLEESYRKSMDPSAIYYSGLDPRKLIRFETVFGPLDRETIQHEIEKQKLNDHEKSHVTIAYETRYGQPLYGDHAIEATRPASDAPNAAGAVAKLG